MFRVPTWDNTHITITLTNDSNLKYTQKISSSNMADNIYIMVTYLKILWVYKDFMNMKEKDTYMSIKYKMLEPQHSMIISLTVKNVIILKDDSKSHHCKKRSLVPLGMGNFQSKG